MFLGETAKAIGTLAVMPAYVNVPCVKDKAKTHMKNIRIRKATKDADFFFRGERLKARRAYQWEEVPDVCVCVCVRGRG